MIALFLLHSVWSLLRYFYYGINWLISFCSQFLNSCCCCWWHDDSGRWCIVAVCNVQPGCKELDDAGWSHVSTLLHCWWLCLSSSRTSAQWKPSVGLQDISCCTLPSACHYCNRHTCLCPKNERWLMLNAYWRYSQSMWQGVCNDTVSVHLFVCVSVCLSVLSCVARCDGIAAVGPAGGKEISVDSGGRRVPSSSSATAWATAWCSAAQLSAANASNVTFIANVDVADLFTLSYVKNRTMLFFNL